MHLHTLTARIDDHLFLETKERAAAHEIPVSEYLRIALRMLNAEYAKRDRHDRLKKSSLEVRKDSQRINAEFSQFESDNFDD